MADGGISKCVSVTVARTQAVILLSENELRTISCSNTRSCFSRGLLDEGCPHYCELMVSARRYFQNRRVKAEIDSIDPMSIKEDILQSGIS